ncbi:deleted in malignant brain tumors 1 protein-like, partial [Clarias magur]
GVRLVNGESRCAGRVEVLHDGQWGTVCNNSWDMREAAVVCRELQCGEAVDVQTLTHFGPGSGPIWMDDVGCNGSESTLKDCSSADWGRNDCDHSGDAGVTCADHTSLLLDFGDDEENKYDYMDNFESTAGQTTDTVRLVNGGRRCAGRVEVLHDGQWGTVCNNSWDMREAAVVCRELGCGETVDVTSFTHFGPGSGPIWMDDVGCNGSESTLKDCSSADWGRNDCDHSGYAGVTCA